MGFLAPALLAGLLAVAIPIIVHLVQRERRTVQAFPSLMFLRRIPNQSVRRRTVRHWPLLALRILAFVLIALAFARPFFSRAAAGTMAAGSREVVVLLDRSASMGYGGQWKRAQAEARRVFSGLRRGDAGSLVLFDADVEVAARSDGGPGGLPAAVDRAVPGPGPTRIGPALRAAAGLFETADAARREIVLISDFQKSGWDGTQEVKLPPGVQLTTTSVAERSTANAAIVGLSFDREAGPKGALVTASARVTNHGDRAIAEREVTLDVDGHRVDAGRVSVEPHAAATVQFAPFAVAARTARVSARMASDALPADDVFHALVTVGGQVPVLVLEGPNAARDASLYLVRALDVAAAPGFATRIVPAASATPAEINRAAVIVLNDARPPSGAAGRALASAVHEGAGLLVLLGERVVWTDGDFDLLPGRLGAAVDPGGTTGGTIGYVDLDHPAFEVFRSPRSGGLGAARVLRYRVLAQPSRVLARLDDGGVALAERKVNRGTVVAWTSTLDTRWNDLPLKPVFVPLVHRLMHYLGRYVEPRTSYAVGDVYDPSEAPPTPAGKAAPGPMTVVPPSGQAAATVVPAATRGVALAETGFYELRPSVAGTEPLILAVNGAPGESDLSSLDPAELRARVAPASPSAAHDGGHEIGNEERERRQSLWWFLLAAGLVLLTIEAVAASRLPRVA